MLITFFVYVVFVNDRNLIQFSAYTFVGKYYWFTGLFRYAFYVWSIFLVDFFLFCFAFVLWSNFYFKIFETSIAIIFIICYYDFNLNVVDTMHDYNCINTHISIDFKCRCVELVLSKCHFFCFVCVQVAIVFQLNNTISLLILSNVTI